jgi:hypothetical protein
MVSLAEGVAVGRVRPSEVPEVAEAGRSFAAMRTELPPPARRLDGWLHRAGPIRAEAAAQVAAGVPTVILLLEPSPRKHRRAFTEGGWWEQRGGLFGPARRSEPRLRLAHPFARRQREWEGLAHFCGPK